MANPLSNPRIRQLGAALAMLSALGLSTWSEDALACGGFFCGRQPVDQTAERILFEVGSDSVTMTTQISFSGKAEDFAWVLPLSALPDPNSLAVFSQRALNALDAASGPAFNLPDDPECFQNLYRNFPQPSSAGPESVDEDGGPPVDVYVRAEVGEYSVAVIGSSDPQALIDWLIAEDYRITPAMEPYIERYTAEGLNFLALKLNDTADVTNLSPFRFTLPGTAPSVPLRMTALAAEPEMSIVVFVLGAQRYEGKNWANVQIADEKIRFNPFLNSFDVSTNWATLVAQGVDAAGGQGWVTESAGSSAPYAEQVRQQVLNDNFQTEDDRAAARALLEVLDSYPYMTRLYTRVSAEEMVSDPVFGQTTQADVPREHQLSRIVDGVDQCAQTPPPMDPCDFTTCGSAGLCRPVPVASMGAATPANTDADARVAGCACLPGATARTTFAPDGITANIICQDGRMSFLNPGANDNGAEALPDPCATFSCGGNGQCISVNMTPTCVCDQGFVAVGSFGMDGTRVTSCVEPPELVPAAFYQGRLDPLPPELPGGREVVLSDALPMPEPGQIDEPSTPATGFPMPRTNPNLPPATPEVSPNGSTSSGGGGCAIANPQRSSSGMGVGWLALGAALAAVRSRTSKRTRACSRD